MRHTIRDLIWIVNNKIRRKWFQSHEKFFFACIEWVNHSVEWNKFFQLFLPESEDWRGNAKISGKQYQYESIEYLLNIISPFSFTFLNYSVLLFPFNSVLFCICVYTKEKENVRRPHECKRKCKCWLWNWHFLIYFFHYFIFVSFHFVRIFARLKPYVYILLCVFLMLSIAFSLRKESKIVRSSGHISTCTPFQNI